MGSSSFMEGNWGASPWGIKMQGISKQGSWGQNLDLWVLVLWLSPCVYLLYNIRLHAVCLRWHTNVIFWAWGVGQNFGQSETDKWSRPKKGDKKENILCRCKPFSAFAQGSLERANYPEQSRLDTSPLKKVSSRPWVYCGHTGSDMKYLISPKPPLPLIQG